MGRLQANAMIMFNKKFNAQQVFLQNSYFMAHIKFMALTLSIPGPGTPVKSKTGQIVGSEVLVILVGTLTHI